ncbi:MAG: ATP-binding protein [Bacteroidales bacterium]|nr:ATP-binding protein [Bacteroidales bacterium]
MKRALYNDLLLWKNSRNRKPLLLQGARQVGKTYLVNQFGNKEYSELVYLNFEQEPDLKTLFKGSLNPQKIISNISLYIGKKVVPGNTLFFFDEIQAVQEVLTSLKYFCEQAPEYHIIAAGSLLGVSLGKNTGFPVGKVNFMTMHPMSFTEYLMAFTEELLADKLINTKSVEAFPEILHDKLLDHLKMYLFLGGMPEVLQDYLDHEDISSSRKIQIEILEAFKRDFSKYTDRSQAIKTSEIWQSIPHQLSKENKKFKYSDVSNKARAFTFEQTFVWLKNAGLIHMVYHINTPKIPLSGYADHTKFKVYLPDTGLLGAMLNITSDIILKPTELFREYNGAFIENFIATELVASGIRDLFYWTSQSKAEVDFIVQSGNIIYPVEVKSGTSRNLKSLRSYAQKYNPKYVIRTSPRNFILKDDFINLPLYAGFLMADLSRITGNQ